MFRSRRGGWKDEDRDKVVQTRDGTENVKRHTEVECRVIKSIILEWKAKDLEPALSGLPNRLARD